MPNEDWMAAFTDRDDLMLCHITFPASHDAGLSEAPDCYIPLHRKGAKTSTIIRNLITPSQHRKSAKADTICQYYDVAGQLSAGSRAFDVRVAMRDDETRTIHAEGGIFGKAGGGYGQTVSSIFAQVNAFLKNHRGEIVILRISHTNATVGTEVARLVTQNIKAKRLYISAPTNLATIPLSQLQGKAIVIFDEKALADAEPGKGLHRFKKYSDEPETQRVGLHICGKYGGFFAGISDIATTAIESGNEHGMVHRWNRDHLFMVYWQEAFDVRHKTIEDRELRKGFPTVLVAQQLTTKRSRLDVERGVHYNLDYLLSLHRGNPVHGHMGTNTQVSRHLRQKFKPNWINLDFIHDDICDTVIEFNNDLLPAGWRDLL